ncbi:MAG: periplasmic heavy metal sensor [Halanaerobacter sp.]
MKKLVSLVLVLSLVLGGSALVFAYSGPQKGNRGQGRNNQAQQNRMTGAERLDLSDEQIEKMEELRDEHFEKQDELRDDVFDKREELREMYFDSEANKDEIVSLQEEVNQLQAKLADARMEHRLGMRDILSDEQLEESADLANFGRRGGQKGRGRDRGGRGRRETKGRRANCAGFGPMGY